MGKEESVRYTPAEKLNRLEFPRASAKNSVLASNVISAKMYSRMSYFPIFWAQICFSFKYVTYRAKIERSMKIEKRILNMTWPAWVWSSRSSSPYQRELLSQSRSIFIIN
jgi:hypothetical protein